MLVTDCVVTMYVYREPKKEVKHLTVDLDGQYSTRVC